MVQPPVDLERFDAERTGRMTSLRKQVKDLKINAKKRHHDFDPEDDLSTKRDTSDDDGTDSEQSEHENLGREHYETVSKSKLREPENIALNEKKYGGQAVSRNKIFLDGNDADALAPEEDEDEDPFAIRDEKNTGSESEDTEAPRDDDVVNDEEIEGVEVDDDDEIDSDEAFEDGEEAVFRDRGFVFRGSGQDLETLPTAADSDDKEDIDVNTDEEQSDTSNGAMSDLEMEDVDETDEVDEDGSVTELSQDEESSDEDEDESKARPRLSTFQPVSQTDREKLKTLIANDTATLASSLSASLSADAKKGAAVKRQYQTFDRLLDARIKLQKGLTAGNDLSLGSSDFTDTEAQTALQKAEEAALKLFSTIESLRQSILDDAVSTKTNGSDDSAHQSKKRKRLSAAVSSTTSSELWTRLSSLESYSVPSRRQVLDKWASKTRSAGPTSSFQASSKLGGGGGGNAQQHEDNSSRPLSTVLTTYLTAETSKSLPSLSESYSDTQFYQSLLRDLINSRSAGNNSTINTNVLPLKLHPSGNASKSSQSGSNNKVIDTKASKGRKVRYTVHAKLENFTASEGRNGSGVVGQWTEGAVTEFFASLLGQSALLHEADEQEQEQEEEGEGEEEALRLFR